MRRHSFSIFRQQQMLRLARHVSQQSFAGFLDGIFRHQRRNPADNDDCGEEERRGDEERREVVENAD